jgi:hypothetical protein
MLLAQLASKLLREYLGAREILGMALIAHGSSSSTVFVQIQHRQSQQTKCWKAVGAGYVESGEIGEIECNTGGP